AAVWWESGRRRRCGRWPPPAGAVLNLRAFARRIEALIQTRMQEKHRLHALSRTTALAPALAAASRAHIAFLDRSLRDLTAQAQALVAADPPLARRFAQLVSVPGIGTRSALRLLGEPAVLPADLTGRQWVAHSGLEP